VIVAQPQLRPIPDMTRDRCPGCADVISAQLQILAERITEAVQLTRLMVVCGGCQRMFTVAPPLSRKAAG
jgi:hypothetical protein